MILKFLKDLSRLDVHAHGNELASIMAKDMDSSGKRVYIYPETDSQFVASIDAPVLVSDVYKISQFSSVIRDTVFALYASPIKVTDYNGLAFRFEQKKYPGVWGPSIDTLLFARALNDVDLSGAKSAIEIGTGSGFLSQYLLMQNPNIETMHIVDINRLAIDCAKEHIDDPRAVFYVGSGTEYMIDKKFDLIICNPPYIPRPISIDDNPYEGVGLMIDLIQNAKKYLNEGGKLIINISSLSEHLVNSATEKSELIMTELDRMTVPLKVFNVINNQYWMEYLLNHKGLQKEYKDGYDFWHTIRVVVFS